MIKRIVAALLAASLLALFSGCEMVSINRDKDRAQVVAKIGDTVITKGELYDAAQEDIKAQGSDIDLWDVDLDETTRKSVDEYLAKFLDSYVESKLVGIVGEKDYPLTDEEKKAIDDQTKSTVDYVKMMLGYDEKNPGAYTGKDIEKDVDDYLATMGTSRDKMAQSQRESKLYSKVKDALTKGTVATEEQVQARYQKDLQAQKDAFATQQNSGYETAITTETMGDYTLYKAVGYSVVKHILLKYSEADADTYEKAAQAVTDAQTDRDDVKKAYDDAKAKVDAAQKAIADAQAGLQTAQQNNDQAKVSEYQATISTNTETLNAQTVVMNEKGGLLPKLETEVQNASNALTQLRTKLMNKSQKTVDTILTRLHNGESFDTLMAQYNEDKDTEGKDNAAMQGVGYVVAPNNQTYDADFAKTALAMTTRGQVSDPVNSSYGIHILYCVYTPAEEVDIPYEACKAVVKTKEDQTAVDNAWKTKLEELKTQYKVQTWPKRVVFVKR